MRSVLVVIIALRAVASAIDQAPQIAIEPIHVYRDGARLPDIPWTTNSRVSDSILHGGGITPKWDDAKIIRRGQEIRVNLEELKRWLKSGDGQNPKLLPGDAIVIRRQ